MSRISNKARFDPASYEMRHPNVRGELRKVVADLPILEDQQIHIDLVLDALLHTTVLYRAKEHPDLKDATASEVRKSLAQFMARTRRLIECIDTMPREAVQEIFSSPAVMVEALKEWAGRPSPPPMIAFKDDLVTRVHRASQAKQRLAPTPKGKRKLPHEVRKVAGEAYKLLTGRRPYRGSSSGVAGAGRRSPFERFLSKLFAVLEINASAEAQARALPRRDKSPAK